MRTALFITCLSDTLFPETGKSVVAVLERLGHHVEFPDTQTCCGQMHWNTGYGRECLPLLERFVRTFSDYDAVVTPSGSCAGMVREYYPRLAELSGDSSLKTSVPELIPRVYEFSEFLVDVLGVTDVGAYFPHRVTYHPTCHALRMVGAREQPLRLLRGVRGMDLITLPRAEECCGFGGTFALKNADVSVAMVADKIRHIGETGAEVVCAGDNSCLMHIGGGLSRFRSGVRTMHLAEILAATEKPVSVP